ICCYWHIPVRATPGCLRRHRRPDPTPDPRRAAGRRAHRRRAPRRARDRGTQCVHAPQEARRGRAGAGPRRRATPPRRPAAPATGGDRVVARPLPPGLGRPARRPGAAPRPDGRPEGATMTTLPSTPLGEVARDGDAVVLTYDRDLAHPPDRVWRAIAESDHLRAWLPVDIVGERT